MPTVIKRIEGQGISLGEEMKQVKEELSRVVASDKPIIGGHGGDGKVVSDVAVAVDDVKQELYIKLLSKVLTPAKWSTKSTKEQDMALLITKLEKCNLATLEKMLPEKFRTMPNDEIKTFIDGEVSLTDRKEMQGLYMNLSP